MRGIREIFVGDLCLECYDSQLCMQWLYSKSQRIVCETEKKWVWIGFANQVAEARLVPWWSSKTWLVGLVFLSLEPCPSELFVSVWGWCMIMGHLNREYQPMHHLGTILGLWNAGTFKHSVCFGFVVCHFGISICERNDFWLWNDTTNKIQIQKETN